VHAVIKYAQHWLTAVNEHSLHSPFLYHLYQTLKRNVALAEFASIEAIRRRLIKSKEQISVRQLGATSRVNNERLRPVAAIAKKGITTAKKSKLLYKIIRDFKCKEIVELGTSFGINTMYLALLPQTKVYTFEGCPNTAKVAQNNFAALGYNNIRLIEGNIDETLSAFAQQNPPKVDLAFIDANHNYQPTINYFNQLLGLCHDRSIIIIDDIYWSPDMTRAWEQLKNHSRVTVAVELYTFGLLFFRPELEKTQVKFLL
jgi:predicted O-methyltransferase YrrM